MTPERRRLTILLSVLGVVIAAVGAFVLFSGSDDTDSTAPTLNPSGGPSTISTNPGSPLSSQVPTTTTLPVRVVTGNIADPFAPKFVPMSASPAVPGTPAPTGTSTTSTTTTTGPTGGTSVTTTTTGAPATTAPPTSIPATQGKAAPIPVPTMSIALIDIYGQDGTLHAQVRVSNKTYTLVAGDAFATSLKLVALDGSCGQFLFGDSPFKLCKGEEAFK